LNLLVVNVCGSLSLFLFGCAQHLIGKKNITKKKTVKTELSLPFFFLHCPKGTTLTVEISFSINWTTSIIIIITNRWPLTKKAAGPNGSFFCCFCNTISNITYTNSMNVIFLLFFSRVYASSVRDNRR
jgi:hypothetical protein